MVKGKLTEEIKKVLTPVQEQLAVIIGGLSDQIIPLAVTALEDVKPCTFLAFLSSISSSHPSLIIF